MREDAGVRPGPVEVLRQRFCGGLPQLLRHRQQPRVGLGQVRGHQLIVLLQSLDLEGVGSLEQVCLKNNLQEQAVRVEWHLKNSRQFIGRNVDYSVIHKLNDRLKILERNVLQDDNRMLKYFET